ncbi:hypothetical protein H6P81_018890 [Aristolochia fimbriata]|uniref:Uncharacterized protein n=1 Tax=Aristolochia fimbriata TaxID=158543 RepID=A0AAV7E586_ARIFI|nr:hypothetical protein H6P81_018890 [Aristolochia fimbriata]
MAYGRSSRDSSIFDAFTLSPLPYPVLLILAIVLLPLSLSWSYSYEEAVESAEEGFNWALLAAPILILLAVHGLSSFDSTWLFRSSAADRRRQTHHRPAEGPPPWGAALLIVLLLLMISYQSTFHDKWFP